MNNTPRKVQEYHLAGMINGVAKEIELPAGRWLHGLVVDEFHGVTLVVEEFINPSQLRETVKFYQYSRGQVIPPEIADRLQYIGSYYNSGLRASQHIFQEINR